MFRRLDTHLVSNPHCDRSVDNLCSDDFRYYDKDGFELNLAEQKFYSAMGHPIWHNCLNHQCWQEPWFELERSDLGLILDHSMLLHRASYSGAALEQLREIKSTVASADYLLKTKTKWGFDFALDAVAEDGTVFEVIHIEFDSHDYDYFKTRLICMEYEVRHKDWQDCARRVWQERSQWQYLKGFAQNDWKAEFLLGWNKSEYTEKTV